MMFPLGVALLVLGYAVAYWGGMNVKTGGQGPGFAETLGLPKGTLTTEEEAKGLGKVGSLGNLTGQPPATTTSPSGGVWT